MDTYIRNGLLERARNEDEYANRAIDNGWPSLAAFHQEKAKELRTAAGESVSLWDDIEPAPPAVPPIAADPAHVMGQRAFWLLMLAGVVILAMVGVAIYYQVNQ